MIRRLCLKSKNGFSLTLIAASVAIIMVILMSSFGSLSFFTKNTATTDALMQQAYYNANSGIEYARFIIEHSAVYNPLIPGSWPKGTNFQCIEGDPDKEGTVTVSIAANPSGGYDITSTGTVKGKTTTSVVHVNAAGKVETWQ